MSTLAIRTAAKKDAPFDFRPVDLFAVVLKLLERENVSVEVLLQLLIGIVDVELLEAVDLEK